MKIKAVPLKQFVLSIIGLALITTLLTPTVQACLPDGPSKGMKGSITLPIEAWLLDGPGRVTGGGQIPIESGQTKPPGGSFGFNAMHYASKGDPKGELEYLDHASGMKVHVHHLDDVWIDETQTEAIFEGPCTMDGQDGYYCWVHVWDNGEPGKTDAFHIVISQGGTDLYSEGGQLLAGNIQIHKK